ELGRNRVRAEPGRDAARGPDRTQLRELRVVVEPVARLPFERRRAVGSHPRTVAHRDRRELRFSGRAGGTDGREDATACGVELLVRGTARAQRDLVDAVAAEARVRVAVDEARNGREPAAVDL